jgi:hypothetical protein
MFPIKSMPTPTIRETIAVTIFDPVKESVIKNTIGVRINDRMNGENIDK